METLIQHCVFRSVDEIREEEKELPMKTIEFYRERVVPKVETLLKGKVDVCIKESVVPLYNSYVYE